MSNRKEDSAKVLSGRWWEFYFVRYFIGTVIGSCIVAYLLLFNGAFKLPIKNGPANFLSDFNGYLVFGFAALGLTYCYIASAPILVLHAVRGLYIRKNGFSLVGSVSMLVEILLATAIFYLFFPDILGSFFLAIAFVFQANLLFKALISEKEDVLDYYENLTKARADTSLGSSEYVESYKHLREHANAFLIVIFEAVLGLVLYKSDSLFTSLTVLVIWIFPAALIWFVGNVLESEYVNKRKSISHRSMNL